MASLDELTGLLNVIQGVQGGKTKQRTQTQLSDEGVERLLADILAGSGGVADIGSSARSAGLYNSTTEDMLLGDLYSRAAVRSELERAPTLTEMETPGVGAENVVGTLATTAALSSLMKGEVPFAGALGKAGDVVSGLLGGGGSTAASTAAPIVESIGQVGLSGAGSAGGAVASAVPEAASIVGTDLLAGGASSAATAGGAGQVAGGALSRAGNFVGANAIPLGGSFLSGLIGGKDAAKDPKGIAINAAMGAMAMGPVGLVAAPVAALVGGLLKDGGLGIGSELKRSGRKVEKTIKRAGRSIGKVFGW